MSSPRYWNPHHHWKPWTLNCIASGGRSARDQIKDRAGTTTIASNTAGAIVQPISSRVLPWSCWGMRSRPLRCRYLIAISRIPPSTSTKMIPAIARGSIRTSFSDCAVGPAGSNVFWGRSLPQAASSVASSMSPPTHRSLLRTLPLIVRLPRLGAQAGRNVPPWVPGSGTRRARRARSFRVAVEPGDPQVHGVVRDEQRDEPDQRHHRRARSPPTGRRPRVEVPREDHPRDERPRLLRVPAPVPAPGLLRPDRAADHAEGPHRKAEPDEPVGEAAARGRGREA